MKNLFLPLTIPVMVELKIWWLVREARASGAGNTFSFRMENVFRKSWKI